MMTETVDRDLVLVRMRLVDLLKSFFQDEPDAEKMSRWRGMFSALSREQISPLFDTAVREFATFLHTMNLAAIEKEYHELFVDPFSVHQVNTMASYYLDGRSFGATLVDLRGFLADIGLERIKGVADSEDSLVMMLDVFARLLERERHEGGEEVKQQQARLLTEFLEPFAEQFSQAMEANEAAVFYQTGCTLLRGYLELEKGLITAPQRL